MEQQTSSPLNKTSAWRFIILLGFVSLFADICYEGARSVTGPFLALLGANAAIVGVVSGSGELFGYGIRYFSGVLSDKTKNYWLLTILGYVINLLAVPLLALAGNWWTASLLIIVERIGKAIRSPPRDVLLSYASAPIGRGIGFGLHRAMDQTGALMGPIVVTAILYYGGSYNSCFAVMILPAIMTLSLLIAARLNYPNPKDFEVNPPVITGQNLNKKFWVYIAALCCIAAGYADFPLIAFHFQKQGSVPEVWIPLMYGIAMGVEGLSALVLGRFFDKFGIGVLLLVTFVAAFAAPLAFGNIFYAAMAGMVIWGIGMGAQESIIKSYVVYLVPGEKRGAAYGLLNMYFGISWFLGSALLGFLYEYSVAWAIIFSVVSQLAAVPLLIYSLSRKSA